MCHFIKVFFTGGCALRVAVTKEYDGKEVLYLLRRMLGLSSAMIRHLKFLDDGITIGGERVTVRRVLREGEVLILNTADSEQSQIITPVELPLPIAYEDEDMVIPDKPAFMPTHTSHDHYDDTVANALAYRYKVEKEHFVFRAVNRLDRNTSGLLIIAKNRIAAAKLTRAMQEKKMCKKYIAILDGTLDADGGVIDTYIRRREESIIVREVCEAREGADRAITEYRVICRTDGYTIVEAEPRTGRTHQLRVHFAHLGAPILGDDLYGTASEYIDRHALHSYSLTLPHPTSGESLEIRVPLPEDMQRVVEKLFPEKDINDEIRKQDERNRAK